MMLTCCWTRWRIVAERSWSNDVGSFRFVCLLERPLSIANPLMSEIGRHRVITQQLYSSSHASRVLWRASMTARSPGHPVVPTLQRSDGGGSSQPGMGADNVKKLEEVF